MPRSFDVKARYVRIMAGLPAGFVGRLSWQYVGTLIGVLTGFAYSIVAARILGVTSFGIIALTTAITTLFMPFLHTNMRDYLVRYLTLHIARGETSDVRDLAVKALLFNLVSSLIYCTAMFAAASFLARFWSQGTLVAQAIPFAAAAVAGQIYITDAAYGTLRVYNRVQTIAWVQIGLGIVRLASTWIALAYFHVGVVGVIAVSASAYIGAGVVLIVAAAYVLRNEGVLDRIALPSRHAFWPDVEQWGFLRRNYLANLFAIPTKDLDVNILGLFVMIESVGIYRMAKNFVGILWSMTDPIHLVLYPEYSRYWHINAYREIRHLTLTLILVLGVSAIVVLISSSFVVPYFITLFAGHAFAPSGRLYIEMIFSIIIWLPLMWYNPLFLAAGRNDISLKSAYLGGAVSIVVYVAAGRYFGLTGMAIAYSVNIVILVGLQSVLGWRSGVLKTAFRGTPPLPSGGRSSDDQVGEG